MARLRRRKKRIKDTAPRKCADTGYPGYPYFEKPENWKPPQVVRFEKLQAKYATLREKGIDWNNLDVISVFYRNNMTLAETAAILCESSETIQFALDCIKQDAY